MQGDIAKLMVMAAAILNRPTIFPQEHSTLQEQDKGLVAHMREHEERLVMEQARLEKALSKLDSKQEESSLDYYVRYFWCTLSLVIFFIVEVLWVDLADTRVWPIEDEDIISEIGCIRSRTLVLDEDTLINLCDGGNYTSAHANWRVREFAEGFAGDLLELLRSVYNREADVEVGDFVGMFESWKVNKPLMCDLMVPFSPSEPYSFQFCMWCSPSSDVPPGMQGCGTIKVTRYGKEEEGSKHTLYLAKDQVMNWFHIYVTKAWGRIAHSYGFDVTFSHLDAPGALKIRFFSGKEIVMNIIPVVQLEGTDAYFVSHLSSGCVSSPDPYWPLSFVVYGRNLLKHVTKCLTKTL